MNNYEDWAQLVAKRLKGEADVIAAIEKDELEDTAANEAFVRAVLEPFLPENFGVGSGRIVDAFGNQSEHIDIVVYNRDFPRIGMVGANNAYLYESVLAVFSVRAKFIRKTFFDSLNACASLAQLETNIDKAVLINLAKKNGLKPGPNQTFLHDDPLRTARFELIGRPPAFMFGFSGIKHSYRQLQENVELWMEQRKQDAIETPMKALPAVIATQGCFAWRNAAPLALSNREMLGIGNDPAPIRLIVLQLLYLLNRRLNVTADGYGLKPSLNAYLSQFAAPNFEIGVGNVEEQANLRQADDAAATDSGTLSTRYEPAKDHVKAALVDATPEPAQAAAVPVEPEPAPPQAEPLPVQIAPAVDPQPAVETEAAVFDKPSPFASAPVPPIEEPAPAAATAPAPAVTAADSQPANEAVVFDKPSPFASAPIPPIEEPTAAAAPAPQRSPAPSAPLGSAPIPSMKPAAKAAEAPPADKMIPPKPPVDFDLGSADDGATEDKPEVEEDDFLSTVVIPPNAAALARNAAASAKDAGANSTDAFIARVKEQLTTPDPAAKNGKDSFSSTIPH
jgi:hypothetical protein